MITLRDRLLKHAARFEGLDFRSQQQWMDKLLILPDLLPMKLSGRTTFLHVRWNPLVGSSLVDGSSCAQNGRSLQAEAVVLQRLEGTVDQLRRHPDRWPQEVARTLPAPRSSLRGGV